MAIQYRYTVSVVWNDGRADSGRLVSVVIDATSPEAAARVALEKNFPKHDRVWVYSWLPCANQITEYCRAERGKVKAVGAK